jgi:hypothetical protein
MTRETVAIETPACRATSRIVAATALLFSVCNPTVTGF